MRSICSCVATRSWSSRSASAPNGPAAAVDEEAGAVGGDDHALAHRLAGGARDARARARRSGRRAITSTSRISGGGLKKCMPTTCSGWAAAPASDGDGDRRGVGGEHRVRRRRPRESCSNSSRLSSSRSGAASITSSQRRELLERCAARLEQRGAVLAPAAALGPLGESARACARRRARAPRRTGRAAASRSRRRSRAGRCPAPIVPAPTTPSAAAGRSPPSELRRRFSMKARHALDAVLGGHRELVQAPLVRRARRPAPSPRRRAPPAWRAAPRAAAAARPPARARAPARATRLLARPC